MKITKNKQKQKHEMTKITITVLDSSDSSGISMSPPSFVVCGSGGEEGVSVGESLFGGEVELVLEGGTVGEREGRREEGVFVVVESLLGGEEGRIVGERESLGWFEFGDDVGK